MQTGLYFDNARYYDPTTGRFISTDPTGFAGGSANLYGYVNADPANFTDPSGLTPKPKAKAPAWSWHPQPSRAIVSIGSGIGIWRGGRIRRW
jgi:uncharacterized protein RhaS with RHS repeats